MLNNYTLYNMEHPGFTSGDIIHLISELIVMASNKDQKSHWVFRAHIMDRSGSLTSVASAFSNEGISISSIVAHGIREAGGSGGSVVLTFFCSEKEKDVMACRVKRLSKVIALEEKLYDSESLRKSIIIKTDCCVFTKRAKTLPWE